MRFIDITRTGASKSGLTNIYTVAAKNGIPLGEIRWYAPWRKYTFVPTAGTVFDIDCLIDIATHIKIAMEDRES